MHERDRNGRTDYDAPTAPEALANRLGRLADDQRAAATAPPGPVLCVAPAGSGKTTTVVARLAWRVSQGADPARVCALTFNRRAAEELQERFYGPGEEMFRRGAFAEEFHFIVEGTVRIEGGGSVRRRGPRQVVGSPAVVEGRQRFYTAVAETEIMAPARKQNRTPLARL